MIGTMCNPGIRDRHWQQMSDIAGFDIKPDSGTTLRKVLKLELDPFMKEFETISGAASKVKRLNVFRRDFFCSNVHVGGSVYRIEKFVIRWDWGCVLDDVQ